MRLWGIFNENGLIKSFSEYEIANKECDKYNNTFQSCGFYIKPISKWREVPFEIMLKCDGEIKCECWLLNNSINDYGVDLRLPMMFNEFLRQIGTNLTSFNCSSLFKQAKWYVIDDGVQPDFFMK